MPDTRLPILFDWQPRYSKSTSSLPSETTPQYLPDQAIWGQPKRSRSRQIITVMREYIFNHPLPLPPVNLHPSPSPACPPIPAQRPSDQYQHRSRTAPVLYPPDELFLQMIRRRSASARLEETRIQEEQKCKSELVTRLAIASAVPPMYFDAPPEYTSPKSDVPAARRHSTSRIYRIVALESSPHIIPRGTITKFREDELFLDEHLKLQIDQTIAQYASISVTEPSPLASPDGGSTIISPIYRPYLRREDGTRDESPRLCSRG